MKNLSSRMDVQFRRMRLGDAVHFSLMDQRYFDDFATVSGGLLTHLYDDRFSSVCEVGGRIVGICIVEGAPEPGMQRVLVSSICVEASCRRLGIARKLLQRTIDLVHGHMGGNTRIELMASVNNSAAIALYESLGFAVQSTMGKAYFDGSDGYIMRLH